MPLVEQLLDSQHARDAIGQVAVPFETCNEPSNVRTQGTACPFRHRSFGCTHFRTDPHIWPSYGATSSDC
jgi:hypothetical protein